MNEDLRHFIWLVWFSLMMAIVCGVCIFIRTHYRNVWLRYMATRASFWTRLGLPMKLVNASRRFNESRAANYAWWFFLIYFLLLMLFSWESYLHFKHRLPVKKPPEAESFYNDGADQNKAGHYVEAISNFSKAIEVFSNYAEAYSFRARAKYNLQDYNGAVIDANKAIELNPD